MRQMVDMYRVVLYNKNGLPVRDKECLDKAQARRLAIRWAESANGHFSVYIHCKKGKYSGFLNPTGFDVSPVDWVQALPV